MTTTQTEALRELGTHTKSLTRQQFKTLKGQILSGDVTAAMKGLDKLLNRKSQGGPEMAKKKKKTHHRPVLKAAQPSNEMLGKIEDAYQEHLRLACLQMRQETADCAMQALHKAFGFGGVRNREFMLALNEAITEYQDDLEKLKRQEADARFEERMQKACGKNYTPREVRYDFRQRV